MMRSGGWRSSPTRSVPDPFDIAHLGGQAQILDDLSRARYGQPINPQLAAAALATGATPDVAAAITQGDTSLASVIPAGIVPGAVGDQRNTLFDSAINPYSFDWKTYQAQNQVLKQVDSDAYSRYEQIGGPPVANVGYRDGVLYWTQKDPGVARKWQDWLIHSGAYPNETGRTESDGNWTDSDTQVLNQYLAGIGEADALYSRNPDISHRAAMSVHQLYADAGNEWDPVQAQTTMGTKPEYKAAVFARWLQAQPHSDTQHLFNEYQDLYGQDALPDHLKQFSDPGWFSKILSIPGDIWGDVGMAWRHRPGWLGGDNPAQLQTYVHDQAQQIIQGKSGMYSASPDVRAEVYKQMLTPTEMAAVAPILGKVVAGQDYLSDAMQLLNPTRLNLMLAYSVGDLVGGRDLTSNPFDSVARAWSGATAHEDNFMAGIFGSQWVHDHPQAAWLPNTLSSFLDPTMFMTGGVSRAIRLGMGQPMKLIEVSSALGKDDLVKNGITWTAKQKLGYINPLTVKKTLGDLWREAVPSVLRNLKDPDEMERVLGVVTDAGRNKLKEVLLDQEGKLKEGLSDDDIRNIIADNKNLLGHNMSKGVSWYNFQSSLRAVTPSVLNRLQHKSIRWLHIMGWDFGHRAMNFTMDLRGALDTMRHQAWYAGPDAVKATSPFLAKIYMNPARGPEFADQFYEELMKHYPEDFQAYLEKTRKSIYDGIMPATLIKQMAVDPKILEGVKEIGGVKRRILNRIDSVVQAQKGAATEYLDFVKQWAEEKGIPWQSSADQIEELLHQIAEDPDPLVQDTKGAYDNHLGELRGAIEELFGQQLNKDIPAVEAQIGALYHAPFAMWEAIGYTLSKRPGIGQLSWLNDKIADSAVMDIWRSYTLASPKTALRIAFGDDMLRWIVTLALTGSPRAAAGAAMEFKLKDWAERSPLRALWVIASGLGAGFGKGIFGAGSGIMDSAKKELLVRLGKMTPGQADSLVRGFNAKVTQELGDIAGPDMRALLNRSTPRQQLHELTSDDVGYREGIEEWMLRGMSGAPQRLYYKTLLEEGPAEAQNALLSHRIMIADPKSLVLQRAQGITQAEQRATDIAAQHLENAVDFQKRLDDLDATMPRTPDGNLIYRAGHRQKYEDLFRSFPKVTDPEYMQRNFGNFRDRVIDRIKYEQTQGAAAVPDSLIRSTKREAAIYDHMLPLPELQKMAVEGKIDHDVMRSIFENEDLRRQLPRIHVLSSQAVRTLRSRAVRPADWVMSNVLRPMIAGARADGMSRIEGWNYRYLKEFYKDNTELDDLTIRTMAHQEAIEWMRNNTYQGSRTIASYALRQAFPFSGATFNQDKFWLNTMKAHPWFFDLWRNAHMDAEQWRRQQHSETALPSWLSWGAAMGDVMGINPIGFTFLGTDGIGYLVPGMGPILASLNYYADNDATWKKLTDIVPGWNDYRPPVMNVQGILSEFIPSYARKPLQSVLAAGGYETDAFKVAVDNRVKYLESIGQRPNPDDVKHDVEREWTLTGAISWMAPVQPRYFQPKMDLLAQASREERQGGKTLDQLQVDPKYAPVAGVLQYINPHSTPEQKDYIVFMDQSVIPLAASIHTAVGTEQTPKAMTLDEYNRLTQEGAEFIAPPAALDATINQQLQNSSFFRDYDASVVKPRNQWLQDSGESTASQDYKDFYKTTIQPALDSLQRLYPQAYEQWIQQAGKHKLNDFWTSEAIGTMNTYSHIPAIADFESPWVSKWRDVMDLMNQTVSNLVEAKNSGSSSLEMQKIAQQFDDAVLQKYANDPEFLNELSIRYHWSSWSDFLLGEVKQQIAAQGQ